MNLLRPIANMFGYDIVKKHKTLKLQWHLESLFKDLSINTVIDVGANIGQYGKFLRSMGYQGEIYSFEPVREYYEQLLGESEGDDKWFAYNYALGSKSEEAEINVQHSMSSFHDFSDEFTSSHKVKRNTETVAISTLNDFFFENFNADIHERKTYLKMDTQGHDLEVFKGGLKILDAIYALQSEVALKKLYKNIPGFSQSIDFYSSNGFDVTGLFPVSINKKSKVIIEVDCVMVNSSFVESFI